MVQVSVGSIRMPPMEGNAPLQVIFQTSKQLAKEGHEVVILDRKYSKKDAASESIEGVEIIRLRAFKLPVIQQIGFIRFICAELNAVFFAIAVSFYLRKECKKIDIIHMHLTSIGLVISMLFRNLRRKMVYTCHLSQWALVDNRLSFSEKIHLNMDSFLMRRMYKVIALSDMAKQSFINIGKVDKDKVVVIPNGVDSKFFRPDGEGTEEP